MKLVSLEMAGFRAFAKEVRVDLDATAIIVIGSNGQGKTSIFDGILWALCGRVPRLGTGSVVSTYSRSGEARVSLQFRADDGVLCKIQRTTDASMQQIRLDAGGSTFLGEEAKIHLAQMLWPTAASTGDSAGALAAALTRSVYLQQDLVREFIQADDDESRFLVVSELVGAGRITELQSQLDRARTAWSRATNAQSQERDAAKVRVTSLESQLESLDRAGLDADTDSQEDWTSWWDAVVRVGINSPQRASLASSEGASALDAALKQLDALRLSVERRKERVARAISRVRSRTTWAFVDEKLAAEATIAATARLEAAKKALDEAQRKIADERRRMLQQRETRQELRLLAELALRHLTSTCPVCTQPFDRQRAHSHLEELIRDAGGDEAALEQPAVDIAGLSQGVEVAEREAQSASSHLRAIQSANRDLSAERASLARELAELDLRLEPEGNAEEVLAGAMQQVDDMLEKLSDHLREGEALALRLSRAGQRARRNEFEGELVVARREAERLSDEVARREETGVLARRVLEGLREAASNVVEEKASQVAPLLQRIYAGIDPHPTFRRVAFRTWFKRGRGNLATRLNDHAVNLTTEAAGSVLSSSQVNALAISIFLAFNLGVANIPLRAVVLDDPLQSLDDVNLLGLVDLLRRTRETRQMLVSTHDDRFGRLLSRKLRPVTNDSRTSVVELSGWSREGPLVSQWDVEADVLPLRITA